MVSVQAHRYTNKAQESVAHAPELQRTILEELVGMLAQAMQSQARHEFFEPWILLRRGGLGPRRSRRWSKAANQPDGVLHQYLLCAKPKNKTRTACKAAAI